VAALNATSSGFDGVSKETLALYSVISSEARCLTIQTVHFQLHQCHDAVPDLLPSHGARLCHRNVSCVNASIYRLSAVSHTLLFTASS
jgi:hypothetical protein